MKERYILPSLIAFRIFNGLVLRTAFNPDEHWQSSEVAHHLLFGYGFLTWEWERCIALRSVMHPALFGILFYILKAFQVDNPTVVALAPRLTQSIIAGFTDYGTYELAKAWYNPVDLTCTSSPPSTERQRAFWSRLTSPRMATCALICSVCSWFNFFCLPRTYSNCLEAALNTWALVFFARAGPADQKRRREALMALGPAEEKLASVPRVGNGPSVGSVGSHVGGDDEAAMTGKSKVRKDEEEVTACPAELERSQSKTQKSYIPALFLAACSVIVRPTAASFWIVFCLLKLLQLTFLASPTGNKRAVETEKKVKPTVEAIQFVKACVTVAIVAISVTLACDSWYYGILTFPPWNFVKFNLFSDPGRFYGAKPWHYFLLEGAGVVLLSFYPLFLLGLKVWFNTAGILPSHSGQVESGKQRRHQLQPLYPGKYAFLRDDGAVILATLFSFIVLSFATHKEFRFMVSHLPQLLIFTAIGLARLLTDDPACLESQLFGTRQPEKSDQKRRASNAFPSFRVLSPVMLKAALSVVFLAQFLTGAFFSFFHQAASDQVASYLRTIPDESSVFFLTPCHQMSYYSHLHRRIPMGFLDCSPRVDSTRLSPSWQEKFWSETRENRIKFLDTVFPLDYPKTSSPTGERKQPYSDPRETSSSPTSNSWFGQAKDLQVTHLSEGHWRDPVECLRYRFEVPLEGPSPTHFIVPSVLREDLSAWFRRRGYVEKEMPIFDALFKETPEGDAMWQYVHILEKQ
ncbi:mannosyltransferase [Cystoisospora suis]|uniref:Mannosyltransferase n=1 Tax=Cystoisospora suis TaxID=483139 RepID=A0A2C6KFT4_9APIC|nr:mannosyltransferase [Cystoisospora suis]